MHRENRYVAYALTFVAVAVIVGLIGVPVVHVFVQAFGDGIEAYWDNLTSDPDTLHALVLTLLVAPIATAANVLFGVAAAWTLARFRFPGRTMLTTLIDLPFSVSPVVVGLVFVLLLGAQSTIGP